jgi:hypothetical protein
LATGSALTFDGTNLGVGVVPTQTLNVKGIGLFEGTTQGNVIIQKTGTSGFSLFSDAAGTLGFYDQNGGATRIILNSSGLEVKQSQLIGYSSYAGIGTNGLAVAGSVGIGTSSPEKKLHVVGPQNGTNESGATAFIGGAAVGEMRMYAGVNDAGNYGYLGAYEIGVAYRDLVLQPNGGNLGLGVTPSAWSQGKAFEIGAVGYGLWYGSGSPSSTYLLNNTYYNSGFKYGGSGQAAHYYQYQGQHVWSIAPSGTAGNAITFTQAMTLDASGNLGIGNTAPGSFDATGRQLVVGNGAASQGMTIYTSSANAGSIFFAKGTTGADAYRGFIQYGQSGLTSAADAMIFGTAGAEKMRLDSAGNLGLGVTPSAWISTTKAIDIGTIGNISADSATLRLTANSYTNSGGTPIYKTTGASFVYVQNQTLGHAWFTAPSGTAGDPITFTQAMTLDASGNLLIGTTAVATSETLRVYRASNSRILIDQASNGLLLGADASGPFFDTTGGNRLAFFLAGTERARIDSSGNLLLGTTTSAYATSGRNLLEINGSTTSLIAIKTGDTARGYFAASTSITELSAVGASQPLVFTTNGAERARIDSSGNLIQTVNTTAATLTTNQTLTFSIVNDSLLRISVRGSDGTTRTATLALT